MGFGLIGTKYIISLCDNVRTKTNRVGLSGIKTTVGLGLSGTEAKVFSWYDVRAKTKRWWNGCSSREAPLATGADAGAVGAAEIWYNDVKLEGVGLE